MRKERIIIDSALQLAFFPILERVDPALYNHIVKDAGLRTLPKFVVKWVSNWFATDTMDIAAASRLLDVMIVSHPSMPMYCAVALLTCNRQRLLQCDPNLHAILTAMKTLPLMVKEDEDDITVISLETRTVTSLGEVEKVIKMGLQYMYVTTRLTTRAATIIRTTYCNYYFV